MTEPTTTFGMLHGDIQACSDTYIYRLVERLTAADDRKIIFTYRGRGLGTREFLSLIHRHAHALAGLGVGHGDVVALFAPNSPSAIAIRYAANLVGAATCYLSAPSTARARAQLVETIAPTLLIVFPQTMHLLPPRTGTRTMAWGDCGPDFPRLDEIAAGQPDKLFDCRAKLGDWAVIVSSGGSTGIPKGSCRDFASYTYMADLGSRPERRQLVNGHLAYLSQVLVDQTLLGGGTVVLRDGFDAADTLSQIEKQRITDLFLVEPQLFELMDHPGLSSTDLSSVHSLVHVGASPPSTLRRRARDRFGPVIAHTYGASEEGLVSLLRPDEADEDPRRLFCAGRILPGVDVRFRLSDGSLAGPGTPGLIEIRSRATAQGYRNQPELSARNFSDGWYRSGDLGFLDSEGYLHILGRADDIEAVDGALVTPTAIEDTLCGLPSLRYAVVILDRQSGRRIAAVVSWPGKAIEEAVCRRAIMEAHGSEVAASLAFVVVERIPLTEQGKPDRIAITALADGSQQEPA